ncbi:hypothetical protein PoB_005646100 [Plakobranchus ocellatus]|uniref:Uncharacterized protein n=1 Tax=Plakobranchus ocellatus TaxID=259542 RepID=A0AAV4CF08_9GAST|nr:hypothetical protein PoB_005646100 [Plakobranchus ocellatus]
MIQKCSFKPDYNRPSTTINSTLRNLQLHRGHKDGSLYTARLPRGYRDGSLYTVPLPRGHGKDGMEITGEVMSAQALLSRELRGKVISFVLMNAKRLLPVQVSF